MSPVAVQEMGLAEPHRPWNTPWRTARRRSVTAAVSAVAASVLYAATGLDGLLGWYAAFVLAAVSVIALESFFVARRSMSDRVASAVIAVGFTTVVLPWLSLVATVVRRGADAVHMTFFTTDMLVNSMDDPLSAGGISHAIVGTLLIVGAATLIAAPLGIIAAVYIVEINGRAARLVRFLTQAMSGVPSIVAGLFVYTAVVVGITHKNNGLAGALALSILMLPTVARTAEEVLKVVPREIRDSAYALGSTQFRTTVRVVLPTVRSGLVTATVLGIARVAGETAPLLLTSQYSIKFSTDMFGSTMASLPTYVFGALRTGTELSLARAWGASLVLVSIVVMLSMVARLLGGRTKGR